MVRLAIHIVGAAVMEPEVVAELVHERCGLGGATAADAREGGRRPAAERDGEVVARKLGNPRRGYNPRTEAKDSIVEGESLCGEDTSAVGVEALLLRAERPAAENGGIAELEVVEAPARDDNTIAQSTERSGVYRP